MIPCHRNFFCEGGEGKVIWARQQGISVTCAGRQADHQFFLRSTEEFVIVDARSSEYRTSFMCKTLRSRERETQRACVRRSPSESSYIHS
jgi:hypothetical protein